jgi:hypothetical protein
MGNAVLAAAATDTEAAVRTAGAARAGDAVGMVSAAVTAIAQMDDLIDFVNFKTILQWHL